MRLQDLALAFAVLVGPTTASAQVTQATDRDERCREAMSVVMAEPARADRGRAIGTLRACGAPAGPAIAQKMRRWRTLADTAAFARSAYRASEFVDAEVWRAVMELAADRTATVPSRIGAFKVLLTYRRPDSRYSFSDFFGRRTPHGWVVSDAPVFYGAPLPANWREETHALFARIADDEAETDTMRLAARHAWQIFRR